MSEVKYDQNRIPVAGFKCEAYWDSDTTPQFVSWETIYSDKFGVLAKAGGKTIWYEVGSNKQLPSEYRPLRTERDKAIEEGEGVIDDLLHGEKTSWEISERFIDALDAGKIPGYGPTKEAKGALNVLDGIDIDDLPPSTVDRLGFAMNCLGQYK